jgi:hypothetical protein
MEKEYYIEKGFAVLAGPYVHGNKKDAIYKQRVIDDLDAGGVPWRVTTEGYNDYIERKGMILPKRK